MHNPITGLSTPAQAQAAGEDTLGAGCPSGQALIDTKQFEAARQAFIAVLRRDPVDTFSELSSATGDLEKISPSLRRSPPSARSSSG